MSAPKGYPSQTKLERSGNAFCTVEPIRVQQFGLSVLAHGSVYLVDTDAAEASATVSSLPATAHLALAGDVIRFTSGALSGYEIKVQSVSANAIVPVQDFPSAPANGVTFQILRHKYPLLGSDGAAVSLDVIDFIDTTPVLDTSSTNIPSSASNPTAIVATLAAAVKAIQVHSDIATHYLGIYTGAALSEVLQCVVGPAFVGKIEVAMAAGERVSIRNMAASAISSGKIVIQFLG